MSRTVAELIAAVQAQNSAGVRKNWTSPANATTGINYYDLEQGAKLLIPVITPLRNTIPRVSGKGGIQANWRAVTAINTANLSAGTQFGTRGGKVSNSTTDYTAVYKSLTLEDAVDWEADLAAMGFDDVKAIAVQMLLWSLMIQEEKIILGGNASSALGTTPTPSLTPSTSGGSIATGTTYSVVCVALTREGYENSVVGSAGVPGLVTRTNADGTTSTYGGGNAQQSASATTTIASGSSGSIAATVTVVPGAVAYAWYLGAVGSERIAAITTINSVVLTAVPLTPKQLLSAIPGGAADQSTNALIHDGFFTFCFKSGMGGYNVAQATGTAGTGTPLTSDNEGGIVEIDTDLQYFWDNLRLSPTEIWVGSQEQRNISNKILTASSANSQRFVIEVEQGALAGGQMVKSYMNKFSMTGAKDIPIKLHPNMPPGTIFYRTTMIPYPMNNVGNVTQVRCRRDYHQIDWPITSRNYQYMVGTDQVLQCYFPPAFGIRQNIANG